MLEMLNKKLEEILKNKEQAVAQLNALFGAEQTIRQLIEETDKKGDE